MNSSFITSRPVVDEFRYWCHVAAIFGLFIAEDYDKLPRLLVHQLPKLH